MSSWKGKKGGKSKSNANPWKSKIVPKDMVNKFTDALTILSNLSDNATVSLSVGNMDPYTLDKSDLKKHGAFYVSLHDMPEVFVNKKFDGGKNEKTKQLYMRAQETASQMYGQHLENGDTVSVEIMGIQNRLFNKISKDSVVIIHGSLICHVPKEIMTKEGLEELCEKTISEGYVVVDIQENHRYKLKRENFPSLDAPEKQKGTHNRAPTKDEYTEEGLVLCGEGFGYDNAAFNVGKESITIMKTEVKGYPIELKVVPIEQVIKFQKEHPFLGDKMMNFYKTAGEGDTYRYTDIIEDSNIFNHELQFQIKHDGETALLHKDKNGKVHLMIKLQVDVYELQYPDSTVYRFGWY